MKPYPFASLNHLTVPLAIVKTPPLRVLRTCREGALAQTGLALGFQKGSSRTTLPTPSRSFTVDLERQETFMQITRNGPDTVPGPSEWFTGNVYLDPVAAPGDGSR